MWCDNCLLIFPLRAGGMAWGIFMMLYSIAGGIFLLKWGQFLYFMHPEWFIYGGISMGVASVAGINVVTFSNRSYIWSRVCKFLWPVLILVSTIRAILMIWQLHRGKAKIAWECANDGKPWGATDIQNELSTIRMPIGLCTAPFSSLWTAFIICLLIDLGFQLYMFFMTWRYSKRLEHYREMKGPTMGGFYNAH